MNLDLLIKAIAVDDATKFVMNTVDLITIYYQKEERAEEKMITNKVF